MSRSNKKIKRKNEEENWVDYKLRHISMNLKIAIYPNTKILLIYMNTLRIHFMIVEYTITSLALKFGRKINHSELV